MEVETDDDILGELVIIGELDYDETDIDDTVLKDTKYSSSESGLPEALNESEGSAMPGIHHRTSEATDRIDVVQQQQFLGSTSRDRHQASALESSLDKMPIKAEFSSARKQDRAPRPYDVCGRTRENYRDSPRDSWTSPLHLLSAGSFSNSSASLKRSRKTSPQRTSRSFQEQHQSQNYRRTSSQIHVQNMSNGRISSSDESQKPFIPVAQVEAPIADDPAITRHVSRFDSAAAGATPFVSPFVVPRFASPPQQDVPLQPLNNHTNNNNISPFSNLPSPANLLRQVSFASASNNKISTPTRAGVVFAPLDFAPPVSASSKETTSKTTAEEFRRAIAFSILNGTAAASAAQSAAVSPTLPLVPNLSLPQRSFGSPSKNFTVLSRLPSSTAQQKRNAESYSPFKLDFVQTEVSVHMELFELKPSPAGPPSSSDLSRRVNRFNASSDVMSCLSVPSPVVRNSFSEDRSSMSEEDIDDDYRRGMEEQKRKREAVLRQKEAKRAADAVEKGADFLSLDFGDIPENKPATVYKKPTTMDLPSSLKNVAVEKNVPSIPPTNQIAAAIPSVNPFAAVISAANQISAAIFSANPIAAVEPVRRVRPVVAESPAPPMPVAMQISTTVQIQCQLCQVMIEKLDEMIETHVNRHINPDPNVSLPKTTQFYKKFAVMFESCFPENSTAQSELSSESMSFSSQSSSPCLQVSPTPVKKEVRVISGSQITLRQQQCDNNDERCLIPNQEPIVPVVSNVKDRLGSYPSAEMSIKPESSDFDDPRNNTNDSRNNYIHCSVKSRLGTTRLFTNDEDMSLDLVPPPPIRSVKATEVLRLGVPDNFTSKVEHFRLPLGCLLNEETQDLIICDTRHHCVKIYDRNGQLKQMISQKEGGDFFRNPSAVTVQSANAYAVKDDFSIGLFSFDGEPFVQIGRQQLAKPFGLAADDRGLLYTLDQTGQSYYLCKFDVRMLDQYYERLDFQGVAGAPAPDSLRFLDVDRIREKMVVTDYRNNTVYVTDLQGHGLFSFGQYGRLNGCFSKPSGVTVDGAGRMFIGDSRNRVQVFDPQGDFQCSVEFDTDICCPSDIYLSSDCLLLISNYSSHFVSVFELSVEYY